MRFNICVQYEYGLTVYVGMDVRSRIRPVAQGSRSTTVLSRNPSSCSSWVWFPQYLDDRWPPMQGECI
jgi:hypothetical protein